MNTRLFLAVFVCAASLSAQNDAWQVGLARAKITPVEPVLMGGYAARRAPSEGVDADIWVKAIAFSRGSEQQSSQKTAVLVTTDILGYTKPLADEIAARVRASRGIERADLLLNASHSHAGPHVDLDRLDELPDDPELRERTRRYVASLADAVVQAIEGAVDSRAPATLDWGAGAVRFPFNRREPTPDGIVIGVHPRGPADRTAPVLRVTGEDGEIRALVFGAATHPATLRGNNFRISGDYAGFAQARIEERLQGVQAMFVLGCAGDSVPHPRGTLDYAKSYGEELGDEALRVARGELSPVNGPLQTRFRMVDLPLQQLARPEIEELADSPYHAYYAERALAWLDAGKSLPQAHRAPLALWRFGDGLTLVAFSGETVVDYALRTERELGPLDLWISAYNNHVFGYLPSARLLSEGGYETRGVVTKAPGLFAPEAEEAVMRAIREMAREVGREVR